MAEPAGYIMRAPGAVELRLGMREVSSLLRNHTTPITDRLTRLRLASDYLSKLTFLRSESLSRHCMRCVFEVETPRSHNLAH